jgi:hypothetical protein
MKYPATKSVHNILKEDDRFDRAVEDGQIAVGTAIQTTQLGSQVY